MTRLLGSSSTVQAGLKLGSKPKFPVAVYTTDVLRVRRDEYEYLVADVAMDDHRRVGNLNPATGRDGKRTEKGHVTSWC